MANRGQPTGERRFRVMAAVSLGAHVAAFALWSLKGMQPVPPSASAARTPAEVEIEMLPEPVFDSASAFGDDLEQPLAERSLGSSSASAPSAAVMTGEVSAAPEGEPALDQLLVAEGESAAGVVSAAVPSAARRLSLDQLGVGQSVYLAPSGVDRRGGAPQKKGVIDYNERLEHSMIAAMAREDQKKGLGPEGPVITQVLASVRSGDLPHNTNARLSISADAEGKILSVSVLSSDGAPQEWKKLADDVFARMVGRRLRSMGKSGFRFTVKVNSRVQLPSGADPGLSVSALGIPLKKGAGPRSSAVSILNPANPSEILGLAGDLSDIGATAQRVVRAHLESLEILGAKPAAAAGAPAP